jgi:SAM-dependent methyltransferase
MIRVPRAPSSPAPPGPGDRGSAFDRLEADAEAGLRATVVLAALELGVFDGLAAGGERDAASLATDLGVPGRRLAPLLDALAALGYLERRAGTGRFAIDPAAVGPLVASSRESRVGEALRMIRTLRGWSWLAEVIRRDEARAMGSLETRGTPSSTTHLCLATRGQRSGQEMLGRLDLGEPRAVLDLGGGTGGYARALLEALPAAHVTLFDLPEVVDLARRGLAGVFGEERLTFIAGDFRQALPAGPYDAILIANVTHIFDTDVTADLIARAAAALGPGGRLVIRDVMTDPGGRTPDSALLFGVHVTVFSDRGRVYSTDEIAAMMASAGLEIATIDRPAPDAEGAVVVGRRRC